jgi:hypothetical protein
VIRVLSVEPAIVALTREQLLEALERVERANDMLPPREDDKVAGRIAQRFVEGLLARVASGQYKCAPAWVVPVPKRALTTRPAAVTTLRDRIVFEALVGLAQSKISKHLVSADALLWPRADDTYPVWNEFERAPLGKGGGFVVTADMAGYYESIDHVRLSVNLADAGVASDLRSAITTHLRELMSDDRGLPQGVQTSNSLATLYLTPVDSALQRFGVSFWRHGDDYRLWAPTYSEARAATYELEQAARTRGLLMNTGKLKIESVGDYSRTLGDIDQATEQFRATMKSAREQALLEATPEELASVIEEAGIDEDMQWRFFYHQTVNLDEMLELLAPSLMPGPIEVVVEMFKDVMSRDPKDVLPGHIAHARRAFCLRRLAQAKAPDALPWVGELLLRRPDETQALANYMLALVSVKPDRVVAACQYALTQKAHLLDWERAWIYRVLSRAAHLVHPSILQEAERVAESDSFNWLARTEAMRLLARGARLTSATASQITRGAPECFQGDIVGIVAMVEQPGNWAAKYLDGARQDALQAVVIDGVRAKVARERQKQK